MGGDETSYQNEVVVELSLGCDISCSGESCRCRNGERYCRAINSAGKKATRAITYWAFYGHRSQIKRDVLRMRLYEEFERSYKMKCSVQLDSFGHSASAVADTE